jgi:hypothetical protein
VTFESTVEPPGVPRCPVCVTEWAHLKPIEHHGERFEPVIRVDRDQ